MLSKILTKMAKIFVKILAKTLAKILAKISAKIWARSPSSPGHLLDTTEFSTVHVFYHLLVLGVEALLQPDCKIHVHC